jgi:Ca-activated chloride channel family protein
MFEFAWPWIFVLLPLPWLMRLVLPVADSGEPALRVSSSATSKASPAAVPANLPAGASKRRSWCCGCCC